MIFDLATVKLLEFDKIYKKYSLCKKIPQITPLEDVRFFTDRAELEATQAKVYIFKQTIEEDGFVDANFTSIPEFELFKIPGFCASGLEIYEIADFLSQSFSYLKYISKASKFATDNDSIFLKAKSLSNSKLERTVKNILRDFDSEGNINENHPALKAIASKKRKIRDSISQVSSKYFSSDPDLWQETIPVFKNGRTLLPIKSGAKNKIQGIVTSLSATRLTSYIEPFELVELNNSFLEIENEIKEIVLSLLKSYSAEVQEEIYSIVETYSYLQQMDFFYSLAEFSKRNRYYTADISDKNFYLKNAKHPLLGVKPIPVTIKLEQDKLITVISGPNTGGKTVALKTVGLFCLMNQFGMDLPADEGSHLPLYTNIFADIGDNQSIELGLSTYSSHIQTIARILDSSSSQSLVLLDELGTGTDPIEGGAIAASIVRYLLKKNISSFITSHIKSVKEIALEDSRVINASMEFDTKSNSPTYKLIFGVSANSYAIETAKRFGLPEKVIEQAKAILASQITDLDIIRQKLSEKEQEMQGREAEIDLRYKSLQEQIRKNDLKGLQIKQKEYEYQQKIRAEESFFIKDARRQLNKVIDEIKSAKSDRELHNKADNLIADLKQQDQKRYEALEQSELELATLNPQEFHEGMAVLVGRFKTSGTLVQKERNRRWLVQTGSIKLTVSEKDLIADTAKQEKPVKNFFIVEKSSNMSDNFSIDCRGLRVDEAIFKIGKAIDNNLVNGLSLFSIVHGKGHGILGPAIHEYLEQLGYVEEYYYASPEDGGTGKTYVKLKV
ncbi:MAG: Smr/MutS family protein [Spirochaetales bacterium]|nr:Smr/MutS family protein [Spirochaetales bacterium]